MIVFTGRKAKHGFTLIEMLVVIGLLGALTALILPSLSANRTKAIGDVCKYNKAGTIRVLKQYENLVNAYPADLHNGLQATAGDPVAMDGMPSPLTAAMVTNIGTTRHDLTDWQGNSLYNAGITSICSGTGLNSTDIPLTASPSGAALDVNVAAACAADGSNPWQHKGAQMHFDGVDLDDWATGASGPSWNVGKAGPVVALWVAPTTDWTSGSGDNNDWSKGNVEYGIDLEGQCPVPTKSTSGGEISFNYYIGYFKVFNDGTPARLIGTTCAGHGPINP
jgi:prepilin-type N-terminal cleavage/methylation domain-containing protein